MAPFAEGDQGFVEGLAELGQRVLDLGRDLPVDLAVDEPVRRGRRLELDRFELTWFPIDRSVAGAQQAEADAFAAAGLIPKAIDVNEVFDFRYAAAPPR